MDTAPIKRVNAPYQHVNVPEFIDQAREALSRRQHLTDKYQAWVARKQRTPGALKEIETRCHLDDKVQFASACFLNPVIVDRLKANAAQQQRQADASAEASMLAPLTGIAGGQPLTKRKRQQEEQRRLARAQRIADIQARLPPDYAQRRRDKPISTKVTSAKLFEPLGPASASTTAPKSPTAAGRASLASPDTPSTITALPGHSSQSPRPTSALGEDAETNGSTNDNGPSTATDPEAADHTTAPQTTEPAPSASNATEAANAPRNTRFDGQIQHITDMMDASWLHSLVPTNRVTLPACLKPEVNYIVSGAGITGQKLAAVAKSHRTPALASSDEVPSSPESSSSVCSKDPTSTDDTAVAPDDIILMVTIYADGRRNSKMQQFLVLGSQPLTTLRDAIVCQSDFAWNPRCNAGTSTTTTENPNTLTRKVSPSFFFIEHTFYNDTRDPDAADYSLPIREWAQQEPRRYDPKFSTLQTKSMSDMTFAQLSSLQLHYPYYFLHQGDCEHVIVFDNVRMLNPLDNMPLQALQQQQQPRSAYPKLTFQCFLQRYKCRMCKVAPAQYITVNDAYSGETPCYFCEKCYDLFHYDQDRKLLYDYLVYPYMPSNQFVREDEA
ncbi:hypothetical protein H4R34_004495 [Dimargaris verticillata]|uniref:snRNA-activating protein complex subunit 3 n=1 Tax=Dimargaris verticillata TaxID=2761393 RepID=A0A9W8E759_9FUNG|nr:hypothetical protein H4R34_004495 [Dimargaris verticillata]